MNHEDSEIKVRPIQRRKLQFLHKKKMTFAIYIDGRESKLRQHLRTVKQPIWEVCDRENLPTHTGDIWIVERTSEGKDIIHVSIERKTWRDLAASLRDARATQTTDWLQWCKETNARPFLLMEGRHGKGCYAEATERIRYTPVRSLNDWIEYLMVEHRHLAILYSNNCAGSWEMIVRLAQYVTKQNIPSLIASQLSLIHRCENTSSSHVQTADPSCAPSPDAHSSGISIPQGYIPVVIPSASTSVSANSSPLGNQDEQNFPQLRWTRAWFALKWGTQVTAAVSKMPKCSLLRILSGLVSWADLVGIRRADGKSILAAHAKEMMKDLPRSPQRQLQVLATLFPGKSFEKWNLFWKTTLQPKRSKGQEVWVWPLFVRWVLAENRTNQFPMKQSLSFQWLEQAARFTRDRWQVGQ